MRRHSARRGVATVFPRPTLWLLPWLVVVAIAPSLLPTVSAAQKILLYSRTAGFRHYNIPTAVATLKSMADDEGIEVVATEQPDRFEDDEWLLQFDALVFVSVSGDALSPKGRAKMQHYVEAGGGFMGIHQACDALLGSPWYGRLVGAFFNNHPFLQPATFSKHGDHPSVADLPDSWRHTDEVYSFTSNPRDADKQVVLTVDRGSFISNDASYQALAKLMGTPHPIAWYSESTKEFPGRSFYTSLGHTNACWKDRRFRSHVWGALSWVLASPTLQSNGAGDKAPGSAAAAAPPPPKLTDPVGAGTPGDANATASASTASPTDGSGTGATSASATSGVGGADDGSALDGVLASSAPRLAPRMAPIAAAAAVPVAMAIRVALPLLSPRPHNLVTGSLR